MSLLLLLHGPGWAATCHVKPAATGSGATWTDAANLQTALANAACDEVWVSGGHYLPVTPADAANISAVERNVSFVVRAGTKVYGGFAGTEAARDARVIGAHPSVLSGDIDGNDVVDGDGVVADAQDIVGSNSVRVVYMDGTGGVPIGADTVLDGFTITGGKADGNGDPPDTWPRRSGGGLYCFGAGFGASGPACSPTLSHLVFSGNRADSRGGALFNYGGQLGASSPTLSDVVFRGNRAAYGGGAMYNVGVNGLSSPRLTDVVFSDNHADPADGDGGAVLNDGSQDGISNAVLIRVRFIGNSARSGGAMSNEARDGTSSPTLTDVVFDGNIAAYGGGAMENVASDGGTSSAVLTDVRFENNNAVSGGAMRNSGNGGVSSPVLTSVTFTGNSATSGGAMYSQGDREGGISSPVLQDVDFDVNEAGLGGAMLNSGYDHGVSNPRLTRVVFRGNSAISGGAMDNSGSSEGTCGPILTDVAFVANDAEYGGAISHGSSLEGACSLTLGKVLFDGNSAEIYGGAMYVTANTAAPAGLILDNVTFSANSAGFDGGAIFNLTDDSFLPLALFNATFAGNSALRAGGAIDNSGTGMDLVLSNVILWNNTASAGENQIHYSPNTPSARIDHSIVQGGDAGSHRADGVPDTAFGSGTGNLATDPLLGPLQDNGGFTLTFLPARDGSAIDTGTCDLFEDQRGVPRPLGGSCDIGAVELDPYPIFASGFEPDTTP